MPLFKPAVPTPKLIERRKSIQARGRRHYIFYRGVLGWGLPVFVLTTLWSWHDSHGWHVPRPASTHLEIERLAVRLIIWSVAGYFFGATMWKTHGLDKPITKENGDGA